MHYLMYLSPWILNSSQYLFILLFYLFKYTSVTNIQYICTTHMQCHTHLHELICSQLKIAKKVAWHLFSSQINA